jgi:tRNA pseudouridine55 synthase
MTQKNNLNGILLLDKPLMLSSNHAIQKIKKQFNIRKVGHTGTLDPLATGLLPVCMGQATRISRFLINSDKTYRALIMLGTRTSTGDKEGEIIETCSSDVSTNTAYIDKVLKSFIGEQKQIPPMHSALKHNGERLYKLAQKGLNVSRKARSINIYSIDLISINDDYLEVIIECSKGTYIRTLAEDIAKKLGTVGHIDQLRRLNIKCFHDQSMFSFNQIMKAKSINQFLLPIDIPLKHLAKKDFSESESSMFTNGLSIQTNQRSNNESDYIRIYNDESVFLGVGLYSNGYIKPKIVFSNNN